MIKWSKDNRFVAIDPNSVVCGSSSGEEGVNLAYEKCSIHGVQLYLICYNESGYNQTKFCFKCFEGLEQQISSELKEVLLNEYNKRRGV